MMRTPIRPTKIATNLIGPARVPNTKCAATTMASGTNCRIAVALAIGMFNTADRKHAVIPISATVRTAMTTWSRRPGIVRKRAAKPRVGAKQDAKNGTAHEDGLGQSEFGSDKFEDGVIRREPGHGYAHQGGVANVVSVAVHLPAPPSRISNGRFDLTGPSRPDRVFPKRPMRLPVDLPMNTGCRPCATGGR